MSLQTAYWLCLGTMCAMTIIIFAAGHFAGVRMTQVEDEE